MTERAIPELSIDTQTLEKALLVVPVGDTISYGDLSSAIGRDVQHEARHLLNSARERVRKLAQMVFEPVSNVGMKRLDDTGVVGLGVNYRTRLRRLAGRGRRKLGCVQNFDALPNELKIELNTSRAQLGAVQHFTSEKTTKKIAGKVDDASKALPLAACLDAMRDSI